MYENIEANHIKIDDDVVHMESVADGKFDFALTQYTDGNFTTTADASFVPGFGDDLFWKLSMESPTPQLVYSITGLYMHL